MPNRKARRAYLQAQYQKQNPVSIESREKADETKNSHEPAASQATDPLEKHTPRPSFAERQPPGNNPINPESKPRNSTQKPYPVEIAMTKWEFIKKPEHANAIMAIFTILIFFATVSSDVVSWLQWRAARDAVDAAHDANKLTLESVRARLSIDSQRLNGPVTAGQPVTVSFPIKNIGHSTGFLGVKSHAFQWGRMPDGDIPLSEPDTSIAIEPESTNTQGISTDHPLTQEFIDNLPTASEVLFEAMKHSTAPEVTNGDSPKPTIYFVGRVVYLSIGPKTEKDFCFFLVRRDQSTQKLNMPENNFGIGDPNFIFMSCPKWNSTLDRDQHDK
jgi:hypothetical protein